MIQSRQRTISMRYLILFIIILLPFSALSQTSKLHLTAEGAPALRILSVPATVDRENKRVTMAVEVKNIGPKNIKGFILEYRSFEVVRGYRVRTNIEMPEVSVELQPNESKMIVLLDNVSLPQFLLDMPIGSIVITSITFQDGSSWKRELDK
jgi:hypothetical protein